MTRSVIVSLRGWRRLAARQIFTVPARRLMCMRPGPVDGVLQRPLVRVFIVYKQPSGPSPKRRGCNMLDETRIARACSIRCGVVYFDFYSVRAHCICANETAASLGVSPVFVRCWSARLFYRDSGELSCRPGSLLTAFIFKGLCVDAVGHTTV